MSTSKVNQPLGVAELKQLQLRSHEWLRLDLEVGSNVRPAQLLRGENVGIAEISAAVKQSGPVGDLIGTFWATVYVITSRFRDALEKSEINGWRAHPITLRSPRQIDSEVSLLVVTGRAGPVFGAGGIVREDLDPVGQYLDINDWDGSEIFVPANRNVILLTERAAQALQAARLRNVVLEPAGFIPAPVTG
jgi:hypothetical protein